MARKYRIDYAVKKDKSVDPPKYFVFFKSRDQDAMTMAFKGYAGMVASATVHALNAVSGVSLCR